MFSLVKKVLVANLLRNNVNWKKISIGNIGIYPKFPVETIVLFVYYYLFILQVYTTRLRNFRFF